MCEAILDTYKDKSYPKVVEVFGLDVMFDSDWNPYVLEINRNQGWDMRESSLVQAKVKLTVNMFEWVTRLGEV